MLIKHKILLSLSALLILIGIAAGVQIFQPPPDNTEPLNEYQQLQQPLSLKIGVTVGGLTLIGLELWWFLFAKKKAP
jgi:plastocyanin domain-containing protein